MSRLLIIRPGAIGDCIVWLPALQHLVGGETEIWAPTAVVPLFRNFGNAVPLSRTGIDLLGVGDLEIGEALRARLQSFDAIVSWYGANRPEFQQALASLDVPCRFYPALPPSEWCGHATDFFLQQVGSQLGAVPKIPVHPVRRPTVVIHPFSGGPKKNWPLANYRALARLLTRRVDWTAGTEEELPEATRFESLSDLADWIAGADLYIGNDSGITHLAAAIGAPTLALFGPTSPARWSPRGDNVTVLHHDPLSELTVAEVAAVANRLLDLP